MTNRKKKNVCKSQYKGKKKKTSSLVKKLGKKIVTEMSRKGIKNP